MRSKIEANEYKDYILGFIFYKYLSDKLVHFAKNEDFSDEDIQALSEDDEETVNYIKRNIGYFIGHDHLFSTWIEQGADFDVSNVRDALSAFSRLINSDHKGLFENIFKTLETGLSKLGETAAKQTKAISELIQLINEIPMDGRQGYDVLGFIYEYLIGMFAANAGKKAGEFYTPHEVSVLMSEIIADHVKDKKKIDIYDSCSGSGSLLLNIGQSIAKHMDDKDNIKYFAQELKGNTYNLTRMNLVMRGILPNNIETRNGDTLEDDWPYFDDQDPVNTYNPLYLDAVVSNPPYSQKWDPEHKENDARYSRFGLAPKSKADFAFLLHDLYHLKPDGIMAIVLPHGVLFRGGEEGTIRKNLIENDHLQAIIGLPTDIFFGTEIPTTILILRQKRKGSDILIVDASKGYAKEGKKNKLRACDIKKITDAVINRETHQKYSRVVKKDEVRKNGYNLNIPRYIDSSESAETWDLHACMFGGIPCSELEVFNDYWEAFPALRSALFTDDGTPYVESLSKNIGEKIREHQEVKSFYEKFSKSFENFHGWLHEQLIEPKLTLHVPKQESLLEKEIFARLESIPLIDKYNAYQILDDEWQQISVDLEVLQTEGSEASRVVEPNIVLKTRKGIKVEVQEGWKGRIIPFELAQENLLQDELTSLRKKEIRFAEIGILISEIIDSLSEAEGEYQVLNSSNDKFAIAELEIELKDQLDSVETDEIRTLRAYLELLNGRANKPEKLDFIETHSEIDWKQMEPNKDGTYGKPKVEAYILSLQCAFEFPEDSFASKLIKANSLLTEERVLKAAIKSESAALHSLTRKTIQELSDAQVEELLTLKWINPLNESLLLLPEKQIEMLEEKLERIVEKYRVTYADNAREIQQAEAELSSMINELEGNEFEMKGLLELRKFLCDPKASGSLEKIQGAILNKIFPQNGEKTPLIRFMGFKEPWGERKLKDISHKIIEKNSLVEFTETFTNSAERGIISQRDYFDKDISNSENIWSYYIVKDGDFVYNPRISITAPVGPINLNKLGRTGVMSPLYTVFRTKDIDKTFLEYFFKTRAWHPFMYFNGDSGARSDRFSIKDSVFFELPIPFPDKEEQQKIGSYFRTLDKIITSYSSKLDKLKQMKSACLENMFD